jgi:hypothetical protein
MHGVALPGTGPGESVGAGDDGSGVAERDVVVVTISGAALDGEVRRVSVGGAVRRPTPLR